MLITCHGCHTRYNIPEDEWSGFVCECQEQEQDDGEQELRREQRILAEQSRREANIQERTQ